MITNQFISTNERLKPFVSNYILSTTNGLNASFSSHWAASNEVSLIFYLGDRPVHQNIYDDSILSDKQNCLIGLSTRYNGVVGFNGTYHTFIIQFESNGINKLFGLPMHQFTNKIYCAEDVFGKRTNELHDRLKNAVTVQEMALFADVFLLHFLDQQIKKFITKDCITSISGAFGSTNSFLNVTECARAANMSVKSFERKFLEQTGVFPKLYMKLLRFNEAIKTKTINPDKSFTTIAYECGYFDQTHFNKEFKQFTNLNPLCFFTNNKELSRPRIDLKQTTGFAFKRLNDRLPNEAFVSVMRSN